MRDKMKLMHKVWYSDLSPTQKSLLTFLISKADKDGKAWPTVATLCQVAGVKHEKNFKGIKHYLDGYVTVTRSEGKRNTYTLNPPAIEGLSEADVLLKETPSRTNPPSQEGLNPPATEGVYPPSGADDPPSVEGLTPLPRKGRKEHRKNNNYKEQPKEQEKEQQPAAPVGGKEDEPVLPLSPTDVGSLSLVEESSKVLKIDASVLDALHPFDKNEQEMIRRMKKDRRTDEQMCAAILSEREDPWCSL